MAGLSGQSSRAFRHILHPQNDSNVTAALQLKKQSAQNKSGNQVTNYNDLSARI